MKADTIWNNLVTTLKAPSLSYMKYVYEGIRDNFEELAYPHIQLEPVSDGEIANQMNNVDNVYLALNLYSFSSNNYSDFKKPIVGDELYKGILGINNDIRAVLKDSYSLGGTVIEVRPQTSQFDTLPIKYPVRGLVMPLRILYRQTDGV